MKKSLQDQKLLMIKNPQNGSNQADIQVFLQSQGVILKPHGQNFALF